MIDRKQVPVPEEVIVGFEQMILLRSVCDRVVPKLMKEDIKLLETLLQSVFPDTFQKQQEMNQENLPSKNFREKIFQLYQIQRPQHGLMLVGPFGCGKGAASKRGFNSSGHVIHLVKLWEGLRLFLDRLVHVSGRKLCNELIRMIKIHFQIQRMKYLDDQYCSQVAHIKIIIPLKERNLVNILKEDQERLMKKKIVSSFSYIQ